MSLSAPFQPLPRPPRCTQGLRRTVQQQEQSFWRQSTPVRINIDLTCSDTFVITSINRHSKELVYTCIIIVVGYIIVMMWTLASSFILVATCNFWADVKLYLGWSHSLEAFRCSIFLGFAMLLTALGLPALRSNICSGQDRCASSTRHTSNTLKWTAVTATTGFASGGRQVQWLWFWCVEKKNGRLGGNQSSKWCIFNTVVVYHQHLRCLPGMRIWIYAHTLANIPWSSCFWLNRMLFCHATQPYKRSVFVPLQVNWAILHPLQAHWTIMK